MFEVNVNAILSKYFSKSSKLINATFEKVYTIAQDASTLIYVIIDEVKIRYDSTRSTPTAK